MSKDPAFLFYPGDWLGGTIGMTLEEKGAYMELLMMQFTRGHMTSHMIGQAIGQLWVKIQDKFLQDDKGLWYNARLDLEKDNRKKFTDSRKNNLFGVNQYSKKEGHLRGHTSSHMEDEDENINELIKWGKQIVEENDHVWEGMRGRKVNQKEIDEFLSIAIRCKWDLTSQQKFRVSLNGFESNRKNGISKKNPGKL